MATHVSCPHCHTTLRIPEGCEGQTTKCPSCLADFVIPQASVASSQAPVCAVAVPQGSVPQAVPLAAKVTEADVERVQLEVQQLAAEDIGLSVRLADVERQHRRQSSRLRMLQWFQSGRQALDHSVGRVGGFFLAVTLGSALLVLVASIFSPSAAGYLIVVALGVVLSGVAYVPFSFYPEDEKLAPMIVELAAKVCATSILRQEAAAEEAEARRKMLAAEVEQRRLIAALERQTRAGKSKDLKA